MLTLYNIQLIVNIFFKTVHFLVAENTRAAYPIEYIPNAKIPCVGPQPKNVILLACDAFGVLPPVSKLNLAQTMYHFISGYTALVILFITSKNLSFNNRVIGKMKLRRTN